MVYTQNVFSLNSSHSIFVLDAVKHSCPSLRHEAMDEVQNIWTTLILNSGTRWRWSGLPPQDRKLVAARAGLDDFEKRIISYLCWESNLGPSIPQPLSKCSISFRTVSIQMPTHQIKVGHDICVHVRYWSSLLFFGYRFSLLVIISELQPVVFVLPSVLSTCAKLQQNTDTNLVCVAVAWKDVNSGLLTFAEGVTE